MGDGETLGAPFSMTIEHIYELAVTSFALGDRARRTYELAGQLVSLHWRATRRADVSSAERCPSPYSRSESSISARRTSVTWGPSLAGIPLE